MSKKNDNNYFEMLCVMAETSCAASIKLGQVLKNFNPDTLNKDMADLHAIEHKGDYQKHALVEKLAKEFITPIEREDIMDLASQIDDVTDLVEDVLLKIYMLNIKSIRPDTLEFATLVEKCCAELLTMMREFTNFRKSQKIGDAIVGINRLEEDGDGLYTMAVRSLFSGGNDPISVMAWTEVYNCLEACCDACEHAADIVENVMMKNT